MKHFLLRWKNLSRGRRTMIVVLIFLLFAFLFRAPLFRCCVSYSLVIPRKNIHRDLDKTPLVKQEQFFQITDHCLDSTAQLLSFTTGKCAVSAAYLRRGGKSNCVGYADLFAEQCNVSFERAGLAPVCQAEPYIAELSVFGFKIHRLFSSPFWKNHDVVLVTNGTSGEATLIDPTLYDYTGIGYVDGKIN